MTRVQSVVPGVVTVALAAAAPSAKDSGALRPEEIPKA